MILTPPEVASLSESLSFWENGEYISEALVALACIGEYVASFTTWFTKGDKDRQHRLEKRSTLLLISALSLEILCLVRTNELSGRVIGSLGEQAEKANEKAVLAIDSSDTAVTKSGQAVSASGDALLKSGKAEGAASNALTLARGARQEADSFEKDIVLAKKQAADAESHLAEALRRVAEATAELDRLKSPRSLTGVPELISTLTAFKDTEYTFSSVCADEECLRLLKSVNDVLQRAGWKRTNPPPGFPAINVFGKDDPFSVPEALTNGVRISVDSPEGLSALQSLPLDKLPILVRTAVSLNIALSSSLSPPENIEHPHPVEIIKGESKTIRIAIGKKP